MVTVIGPDKVARTSLSAAVHQADILTLAMFLRAETGHPCGKKRSRGSKPSFERLLSPAFHHAIG